MQFDRMTQPFRNFRRRARVQRAGQRRAAGARDRAPCAAWLVRDRLRRRPFARRHARRAAAAQGRSAGTARDPPRQPERAEHRGAQRRQGRARRSGSPRSMATARTIRPTSPSCWPSAPAPAPEIKLFAGWRVNRQDSGSKRWASKWANAIRARMLRDDTPDTGCGIKLFERAAFLDLPYFDHMHRYLPALMQRAGWKTVERAGQPPRALGGRVQVQQPQPRAGRHRRPARRGLADQARQGHAHRRDLIRLFPVASGRGGRRAEAPSPALRLRLWRKGGSQAGAQKRAPWNSTS